jgi:hypothetical protein
MKHFCTIPIDLKADSSNNPHYVFCGNKATHKVKDSDWYICGEHVEYAEHKKWEMEKIKEA